MNTENFQLDTSAEKSTEDRSDDGNGMHYGLTYSLEHATAMHSS